MKCIHHMVADKCTFTVEHLLTSHNNFKTFSHFSSQLIFINNFSCQHPKIALNLLLIFPKIMFVKISLSSSCMCHSFTTYIICDWACKNQAYLHKLHMFRKGYISSSLCMINDFCDLHITPYGLLKKSH